MSNIFAISAEGVSKKFCRTIKHTMFYGVKDLSRSFFGLNENSYELRDGEFWALNNVSFQLEKGEILGIIGPNGSGKSTLLKMLNGIFMPDKGHIRVRGRVGALIEVGAGFHPMLTGRENIYVNGSILGMSKKEINEKFDEIVDFAGIHEFIDSPVKHYSSGMHVRLGFSVAIHCEPDVLIVDEVLAVGDVDFRRKCAVKMREFKSRGVSIVFVTHDLGSLRNMCNRAICLNSGKIIFDGNIDEAISHYLIKSSEMNNDDNEANFDRVIKETYVTDHEGRKVDVLYTGEKYFFILQYITESKIVSPYFGFALYDSEGILMISASTKTADCRVSSIDGSGSIKLEFPVLNIIPGIYRVRFALHDSDMGIIDDVNSAITLTVKSKNYISGAIFSGHQWHLEG